MAGRILVENFGSLWRPDEVNWNSNRPRRDAQRNVAARAAIDISIARDLSTDRIRRGWRQTELARRSGARLETISRIESGKHIPRQETLLKLDRALSGR